MKPLYTLLAALLIVSIGLAGCQKKPINGDLDGQWEVMEVYPSPSYDSGQRLFYNFSLHVCSLTMYGSQFTVGTLSYDNNVIYLDFPDAYSQSSVKKLEEYGIYSNPVSFNVEFEGKKRLVLSNDDSTIILRKF